jgi:hypothetical protein
MPIFQELETALNLFSMEDSKNPIAIHSQEQPPLKPFFISIYKWKALAHVKSLLPSVKGPIFLLLYWVFIFYLYTSIKRA